MHIFAIIAIVCNYRTKTPKGRKNMKIKMNVAATIAIAVVFSLMLTGYVSGQALPKAGETIDKTNYKKYAHLFPDEFLRGFEDGWGVMKPISIKVSDTKPAPIPKDYKAFSEKNKGKYQVDAQGMITGNYSSEGLPFPDVAKGDKDLATKVMYNFQFRYMWDDLLMGSVLVEQRKGEPVRFSAMDMPQAYFLNRMVEAPKPKLDNPGGLLKTLLIHFTAPESQKNTMTLTYRSADLKKVDETYVYMPTMRKVIRGEAGQRSTPVVGSIQSLDDFYGFDGKAKDFTYTLVKEQKVLAIVDTKMNAAIAQARKTDLAFPTDNWEVRDVYVIDIKAKDPKYPQSKKRIWLDKENMTLSYFAVAWDKAGKPWKVFFSDWQTYPMGGGEKSFANQGSFAVDLQFGMVSYIATKLKINGNKYTYNDFTTAALQARAR